MRELPIKAVLDVGRKNLTSVLEKYEYRYLPKSILQKSMSDYLIYENAPKVLEYILNAFYVYRDAVNMTMFAPFVLKDGAYEWLDSASFDWRDIDTVKITGQSIHNRKSHEKHPFLYKVEDASKIGVLFSQDWQIASLRKYANPIYYILQDWKIGKSSPEKIGSGVINFLKSLDDYIVLD